MIIAILCGIFALVPAVVFFRNLPLFARLPRGGEGGEACSVLIPARNEERNIGAAVESILRSPDARLEVIVLDDGSTDRTAEIVREFAARDSRVRLEIARPLPPGWAGKAHACHQLATLAARPLLLFLDADVRMSDPATIGRLAVFMERSGAALVSGVPREQTVGFLEKLVVPLIHFVLLGFLPLWRMRACTSPSYAAGCGQIIAARRDAYDGAGGHACVRNTWHDGIALARLFRAAGYRTDLFDGTDTFHCRMYATAGEVWNGFAKNASEGLGSPILIGPSTLVLIGGQVLPLFLAFAPGVAGIAGCIGAMLLYAPRVAAAVRFRQSPLGALLHPLGVLLLVAIQYHALIRSLRNHRPVWKDRLAVPASRIAGTANLPIGSHPLK